MTLLDGVTGSGKTEVYFEAVAETIRRGRQALILLPEIALTGAVPRPLRRALRRAAGRMAFASSRRASARAPGRRSRDGEVQVVVGARSALFLPYADLGLIVVDEEHDPAYKQEDGVHYHARDMAVVRARDRQIPVVLSSATPSVETRSQCAARTLRAPALAGAFRRRSICRRSRPSTCAREGPPRGRFIAPRLAEAVQIALERGEQALLFLNRRGYAPLTLCRACGHRIACPNCDAWLVDHRFSDGSSAITAASRCRRRRSARNARRPNASSPVGPGVERLEEEAAELFPGARTLVLSSDLVESVERMREELDDVARGPLRYRHRHAARRQGPSFSQAQPGRHRRRRSRPRQRRPARGRAHLPVAESGDGPRRPRGRPRQGLLQTHQPEHPVMQALISRRPRGFLRREIALRERTALSAVRPACGC